MRTRTVAVILTTLLVATTAASAQGGGFGGGRPGMGGRRMGGPMGPPRGERPDPLLLAGPPAPDSMATIVTLDTAQQTQYRTLYERFMKLTQADRDELRELRERMREAMQNQDRSAGMEQMQAVRDLMDHLREDQKAFDDTLKSLLSRDQWKTYDKWRKDARKRMEEAQRPGFLPIRSPGGC